MQESSESVAISPQREYIAKVRRRCAWSRWGGALLCLAAVPSFAVARDGAHFAGLVLLVLGASAAAGGFYWDRSLRGAREVLASEPRQMLMDRWLTPGVHGAWRTRLRTASGESEMLGSGQISSAIRRVKGAQCLVYGPLHPGGLVIVALGEHTLVGSSEPPRTEK